MCHEAASSPQCLRTTVTEGPKELNFSSLLTTLEFSIGSTVSVQYRTRNRLGEEQCWLLGVRTPKIKWRFWLACMSQLKHHFGHPTRNWHKGSKPMQTATRSSFKVWGELWKAPLSASQLQHVAGPEAWLHVYDLNGTKASVMKSSFLSHWGICHCNQIFNFKRCPILADHSDTRT